MRSDVVLLSEPLVDDGLGLLCRREPFGIENLPGCCQTNANLSPIPSSRSVITPLVGAIQQLPPNGPSGTRFYWSDVGRD